jgi:hypothetical protein
MLPSDFLEKNSYAGTHMKKNRGGKRDGKNR